MEPKNFCEPDKATQARDAAIMHIQQHHGIVGYDAAAKLVDEVTRIVTGGRPVSAENGPQSVTPIARTPQG